MRSASRIPRASSSSNPNINAGAVTTAKRGKGKKKKGKGVEVPKVDDLDRGIGCDGRKKVCKMKHAHVRAHKLREPGRQTDR